MQFGYCKECRKYRLLVSDGKCRTHTDVANIDVGVRMMSDNFHPSEVIDFCSVIRSDLRTVEDEDAFDAVLVLTSLEVIVEDEEGEPLETFDYSEYDTELEVQTATEDAVDWVADNKV